MILERIKTWLLFIGGAILAIISALFYGEWKGKSNQEEKQKILEAKDQQKEQQAAADTFKEAQSAAAGVEIKPPDVEKRDDLNTTN